MITEEAAKQYLVDGMYTAGYYYTDIQPTLDSIQIPLNEFVNIMTNGNTTGQWDFVPIFVQQVYEHGPQGFAGFAGHPIYGRRKDDKESQRK